MNDDIAEKHPSRKRKKSFIKNARKYGKKGRYGRGQQLEPDFYNYLVEIMTHFKQIENDEEKSIFVNNVFEQIKDQELNCSYNQVGCRVIEALLPFANDSVVNRFIDIVSEDLRPSCSDTFASHVVEAVFVHCYGQVFNSKLNGSNINSKCFDYTLKVAKFLLNNLEDFVWDTYGNHIIRTVLQNFAMLQTEKGGKTYISCLNASKDSSENMLAESPTEYNEIVCEYAERLLNWPQFSELPYSDLTSGFLQVVVKSLAKLYPQLLDKYFKKLMNDCFVKQFEKLDTKYKDTSTKSVIVLLETFIQNATPEIYSQIYAKCFHSKLAWLAKERSMNFAVQKLLDKCSDKTEFESIFDELVEHFHDIAEKQHTGVILSMGAACKRLSAKQGSFVQALMKLFNCFEPQERQDSILVCLVKWMNYDSVKDVKCDNFEKQKLHLHGTLIIQLILTFNKPIKIINSILNLETSELKGVFCNSMGCHIVDSYVKSQYVGEKSRERLLRKMQGTYQELASSKYGSRAFDALWEVASLKMKLSIMNELIHKEAAWANSQFGKIIANKINLNLYKRNKDEWKNFLNKNKAKTSLADIFK